MSGDTIMHSTVRDTKLTEDEILQILNTQIRHRTDLNIKNSREETVLHVAVFRRGKNIIDFLLKNNAKIDIADIDGNSIAHLFIIYEIERFASMAKTYNKDLEDNNRKKMMEIESAHFVKWMLSRGFDFDCQNKSGQSAMDWAIENNLQYILPALLKNRKNINFSSKTRKEKLLKLFLEASNGQKCGSYSIKYMMLKYTTQNQTYNIQSKDFSRKYVLEIIKIIFENGISIVDEDGIRALDMAMYVHAEEQMDVVNFFLDQLMEGNYGYKIVHEVIEKATLESPITEYYLKVLQVLLDRGINMNIEDKHGLPYFYYSVNKLCLRVIKLMKENGTDFSFITSDGQNGLFWLFDGMPCNKINDDLQEEIFDLLIKEGCKVNLADNIGLTPLHLATEAGKITIVKKMLTLGVDVNCQDYNEKKTPLHLAAGKGFSELSKLLLNSGENIRSKDSCNNQPLHLAVKEGYLDLAKFFLNRGANVNCKNSSGDRPLHLAGNNKDMLQMLLDRGAMTNARNNIGESAFVKVTQFSTAFFESNQFGPDARIMYENIEKSINELLMHGAGINNDSNVLWIPQDWSCYCNWVMNAWIKQESLRLYFCKNYQTEIFICYCESDGKYPDWLKEIKTVKNTMIDSHTSIYNWLYLNFNRQCIYIHNQNLQEVVHSLTIEKQYPHYSTVILGTYRKCETRKSLNEQAKEAWNKFTNIYWPDICIEHIFSYLNNGDLIDVSELVNCIE